MVPGIDVTCSIIQVYKVCGMPIQQCITHLHYTLYLTYTLTYKFKDALNDTKKFKSLEPRFLKVDLFYLHDSFVSRLLFLMQCFSTSVSPNESKCVMEYIK